MSLQNTEKVLLDFIKSNEPQVLALKGTWGSGKTYFWENFLKTHKNDTDLGFKKYSYVSLFGIKDSKDIKNSIYYNGINEDEIREEEKNSLNQKVRKFFKKGKRLNTWAFFWKKSSDVLDEAPTLKNINILKLINAGISAFGFLKPKEYLVCLDDFERTNQAIDTDEILGLISELKEKRKCKVILIFNDEKLTEEKKKAYDSLKEKVIDIEIEFNPTPEECTEIIFPNYKIDENEKQLYENSVKLGIKNIRILKKIKSSFYLFKPFLSSYHPDLKKNVILALCFFNYSYYSNPNDDPLNLVPGIDFLKTDNSRGGLFVIGDKEKEDDFKVKWRTLMRTYGYSHSDELDLEILEIIKRGYIIEEDFHKNALTINSSLEAGNIKNKLSELWTNLYHCGFKNNIEDFISSFLIFFHDNGKFLNLNDLNSAVGTIRDFKRDEDADKLIDYFIKSNSENPLKFDLERFDNISGRKLDEKIKSKVIEVYQQIYKIGTPIDTLNKIIKNNYGFSKNDAEVLFTLTEEQIYNIFKDCSGDTFLDYSRVLLQYQRTTNASAEWKELTEKTLNALKKFDDCEINHQRLISYGIIDKD